MSVVLGKLAEPHPDGLVSAYKSLITYTTATVWAQIWMSRGATTDAPLWHDDPLYFAAERNRANKRRKYR